jgi:hypothetical protein
MIHFHFNSQEDILYFETLFIPAVSYDLLPDDNMGAASISDGDSVVTANK